MKFTRVWPASLLVLFLGGLVYYMISSHQITPEQRMKARIERYFRAIDYPRSEEDKQHAVALSRQLVVSDTAVRPLYAGYMDSPAVSDRVRMHCMAVLSLTGDRTYFRNIAKFLDHTEEAYRVWAMECLELFRVRSIAPRIVEASHGLSPENRITAARVLKSLGSSEAIPRYIDYLDLKLKGNYAPDSDLVQSLVRALSGMTGQKFGGDPQAWRAWWRDNREVNRIPLMEAELFQAEDLFVRMDIIENLAAIGTEPIIHIMKKLVAGEVDLAWGYATVVREDGYECALECHADFSTVVRKAVWAIGEVDAEPYALQTLLEWMETYSTDDSVLAETLLSRLDYPHRFRPDDPQDLKRLRQWWEDHRTRLTWDFTTRKFVLSLPPPAAAPEKK